MPLSLDVRRDRLSRFVLRAMQAKKIQENWTVDRVLKETGIGRTTLYRWINKEWDEDPRPGMIEKFCDGMGIPAADGLMQLWPGKYGREDAPASAAPMPREIEIVLRRLADESTPAAEKQVILSLVQQAAGFRLEDQPATRKRRAG